MKKLFRNIILMILFCCVVLPDYLGIAATESSEIIATEPSKEEYDVRKVRWGMSVEEIKKSEKSIINRFPEKKRPKGVQYNTIH